MTERVCIRCGVVTVTAQPKRCPACSGSTFGLIPVPQSGTAQAERAGGGAHGDMRQVPQ